jgi:hypothetical protein
MVRAMVDFPAPAPPLNHLIGGVSDDSLNIHDIMSVN